MKVPVSIRSGIMCVRAPPSDSTPSICIVGSVPSPCTRAHSCSAGREVDLPQVRGRRCGRMLFFCESCALLSVQFSGRNLQMISAARKASTYWCADNELSPSNLTSAQTVRTQGVKINWPSSDSASRLVNETFCFPKRATTVQERVRRSHRSH
jgi:hypothetical protein